ncbi:hypothetical protein U3516DRAFT_772946 [Neocallimastix sp. 'constans']
MVKYLIKEKALVTSVNEKKNAFILSEIHPLFNCYLKHGGGHEFSASSYGI